MAEVRSQDLLTALKLKLYKIYQTPMKIGVFAFASLLNNRILNKGLLLT